MTGVRLAAVETTVICAKVSALAVREFLESFRGINVHGFRSTRNRRCRRRVVRRSVVTVADASSGIDGGLIGKGDVVDVVVDLKGLTSMVL